jgi:STE24 endopeptidase
MLLLTLLFILTGGFNLLDEWVRSWGWGSVTTGLGYLGILTLALTVLGLPFSYYRTFVLEEKYGFNKTTHRTFVMDVLKGLVLSALLGLPVLALILWFFEATGTYSWIYCWGFVTVFQLVMSFLAPIVIMPLFNKFTPLEEGELKSEIEHYAQEYHFAMSGVFTMDGSKRSSKSNAFFTGFGKLRRIVLFDTLIEKHTVKELVAVLAHEMGHCQKKHILKSTLISIASSGITFWILAQFLNHPGLFEAFQMKHLSIYASLIFFSMIYAPIELLLGVGGAILSRKHEFEADRYSVETYGEAQAMIDALKKLSVDNLSNLTPHPLKVFLEYSHPPVLERIRTIQTLM